MLPTLIETVENFVQSHDLLVCNQGWISRVGIDAQWYPDQSLFSHLPPEAINALECLDTVIYWEVFSDKINVPRAETSNRVITCGMSLTINLSDISSLTLHKNPVMCESEICSSPANAIPGDTRWMKMEIILETSSSAHAATIAVESVERVIQWNQNNSSE